MKELEVFVIVKNKYFKEKDVLDFDLFFLKEIGSEKQILIPAGQSVTKKHLDVMNSNLFLYVEEKNLEKYTDFVFKKEEKNGNEEENYFNFIDFSIRVYKEASASIEEILNNPDKLSNLDRAEEIVSSLVDFVLNDYFTLKTLFDIMSHDYYTHTHSINVCIYSLAFGKSLGLNQNKLKDLGIAAILHDLGKSKIDYNIINKNGVLNSEEYLKVKKHPFIGYYLLKKLGVENEEILSGIKHHHEKIDGSGYPDKLKGNQISLFAKIIGISDIFDALSTKRAYKKQLTSFESLKLMKKEMFGQIDTHMLNEFILMFK